MRNPKDRPPNYEDGEFRMWALEDEEEIEFAKQGNAWIEIDTDKEDVYESRVYTVRPITRKDLSTVFRVCLGHPSTDAEDALALTLWTSSLVGYKILAKIDVNTGAITAVCVSESNSFGQIEMWSLDEVTEEEFRKEVEKFERINGFLFEGEPLVVTREQFNQEYNLGKMFGTHS